MTARSSLFLCAGGALALAALGGCGRSKASDNGPKPIRARVVAVKTREVQRTVQSVGSCHAFEEVTVGSEVDGRVQQVFVDIGDKVDEGRALARIVPLELSLDVDEQRASLKQIESRLTDPDGAPIAKADEAAEVRKADADRADARQKYDRAKELMAEGLISKSTFEEVESRQNSTRAAYDMALQNVRNLQAQAAQRTASLARAGKKLGDATIRAPFAGEIRQRLVSPGQYVKIQTPVMVLVDTDPIRVRLNVPEKVAGWIAVGQVVKVQVEAYPGREFAGKVSRMSPSVDMQTRTLEVEALLDNKDGLLKPGFFARAEIVSNHLDRALVVPQEALRYLYGVYKIYRVENKTLHETEVKLGSREGSEVEIESGLDAGARVAVPLDGGALRDGAPVAEER
jgi:RND family efflux transporter MFP subunit